MNWWADLLGEDQLSDPSLRTNPLGEAWRQYKEGDWRAPFSGKELIRVVALAQALRSLGRFPTRSRYGVVREDDHFQAELLRRSTLASSEFDSVEFEATIARAYQQVVRAKIVALEPRGTRTPDFEIDMGRPVAIEAKARASYTPQDTRIAIALDLVRRELEPEVERLRAPLAVQISTKVEPTSEGVRGAIEVARTLMRSGRPGCEAVGDYRVEAETLGGESQEYSGADLVPYGSLAYAEPPVRDYLTKWYPAQSKREYWAAILHRSNLRRDGATLVSTTPRLLLVRVLVSPDNTSAIEDLIHRARKQLPRSQPGAIFVRATEVFSADQPFRLGRLIAREMLRSERIGAVTLWHLAVDTTQLSDFSIVVTLRGQLLAFVNPNALHPLPADFVQRYLPYRDGFTVMNRPGPMGILPR